MAWPSGWSGWPPSRPPIIRAEQRPAVSPRWSALRVAACAQPVVAAHSALKDDLYADNAMIQSPAQGGLQMLAGGVEPGERVHERPAAGRLLGGHNTVSVFHRGGQRQLDEHVPAGLHGRHRDLGLQPGRQADVHQIHRGVGDQAVQVGGGGKAELSADRRQLVWGAAEDDHFVHIGSLGVDGGVGLAETGSQQRDLHGGQLLPPAAKTRQRP
jgi:hypothetical protein